MMFLQEKIIEVPQVQVVEKIIEVPQKQAERGTGEACELEVRHCGWSSAGYQVHEVIKHVPKLQIQEVVRHVEVQVQERIVEVPHIQTIEKVPKVQIQEVVRHEPSSDVRSELLQDGSELLCGQETAASAATAVGPLLLETVPAKVKKPVIETREKIVEIPCVQAAVAAHGGCCCGVTTWDAVEATKNCLEVIKEIPKVMEVQEIVKTVQRVDWTGETLACADVSAMSGGSLEASLGRMQVPQQPVMLQVCG
eukprot:Skav208190  [mRNA]  locus=scaffold2530:512154:516298:- [translate_table: standard]